MLKSGWLIGALVLPLAACSNSSNSGTEAPSSKSGLSSTLVLSAANDAQKLQFCNWLASVSPTNACGAPSALSPDGGAPEATDGGAVVAPDGGAGTAAAQCLATFTRFANGCTVEATEQCFSSWEAAGACEVPAKANCAAYDACAKSAPPANGQVGWYFLHCMSAGGQQQVGTIWVTTCANVEWYLLPVWCDGQAGADKQCNDTHAGCNGGCTAEAQEI